MNMEDWNRINQASSDVPRAREKATSFAETRTKINDLRSSFTKTISNNIASTNSSVSIPEMVSSKATKNKNTKQDENMDDLLNKMGLAVQRKGGY